MRAKLLAHETSGELGCLNVVGNTEFFHSAKSVWVFELTQRVTRHGGKVCESQKREHEGPRRVRVGAESSTHVNSACCGKLLGMSLGRLPCTVHEDCSSVSMYFKDYMYYFLAYINGNLLLK